MTGGENAKAAWNCGFGNNPSVFGYAEATSLYTREARERERIMI